MAKYEITATRIVNYSLTVEANSEGEAIEYAQTLDIDDFDKVGGEFTIDYAEDLDKCRLGCVCDEGHAE
jgi:hypothetical protein